MTDAPAPAAAPSPAPAPAPAPSSQPVGMPVTPAAFDAPEAVAARTEIKARINDKEFYTKLKAQDPAAHAEWSRLHAAGYPPPQQIASVEDVNSQAAARNEEQWNSYFAALQGRFPLTEENRAELRAGVIRADLHAWARDEKDRLIKDRGFRTKVLDGDRDANRQWGIITSMLSLRPVKQ